MIPLIAESLSFLSEHALLLLAILVIFALLLTKIGYKFGMPTLLLFLVLGLVAGKDVMGMSFENFAFAHYIGEFAISIILLTGGLQVRYSHIKPVFRQGVLLSTLGVFLTAIFTAVFIFFLLGSRLSLPRHLLVYVCLMIASILSSTDSTAVFSVMKGTKIRLKEHLGPLLELESGSNDPMALTLTIVFVRVVSSVQSPGTLTADYSYATVLPTVLLTVFLQIGLGFAIGLVMGKLSIWLLRKVKLDASPLYAIMILALGIATNTLTSILQGNGLLALYVMSIAIGSDDGIPFKKEIIKFFDGITWLAQLLMFLMLGLLASPSQFSTALGPAVLIGLFMIFIARPVSVFMCLAPFRKMSLRSKFFVSWVGMKGAGPILFATAPVVAGLEGASEIFNIVFIITLLSMVIQGFSLPYVGKLLKVSEPEGPKLDTFGMEFPEEMGALHDYTLTAEDLEHGDTVRHMQMAHGTRIIMIKRDNDFVVPHGSLKLYPGDKMVILESDSSED